LSSRPKPDSAPDDAKNVCSGAEWFAAVETLSFGEHGSGTSFRFDVQNIGGAR
jgi:hypothetical protein